MEIIHSHPIIEPLFEKWREHLGQDYTPYRNHVYRVFNLSVALADAKEEAVEKLAIASAFHDIGIWLDKTFDYIEPSVSHASDFLLKTERCSWISIVVTAIREHHKIFPWSGAGSNVVEAFRRADWLDVCLFALPTRLEKLFICDVLKAFPRKGFHYRLIVLSLPWMLLHPLRPMPMLKL